MRLVFVNRSYWPEETATAQLLADLAEGLAGRGWNVTVLARCPAGAARREVRRGVSVVRVRSTRRGDGGSLAGKALDLATFYLAAFWRLRALVGPGDAVVALTDPPLIGVAAEFVARRRGAACLHWVQDIYPEIAMAVAGRRALRAFRPARDRAWRGARACVTLGRDMAAVIARSGVPSERIFVVPNWAPQGLEPPSAAEVTAARRAWGLDRQFVAEYSGNLGRVHDLEAVLDVAEALREQTDIVFLFVGGGPAKAAVEEAAARRGLTQVRFRPHAARAALAGSLAAGDVHLVALRRGCEAYVYPSKIYGAAAVGRPVLFLGPAASEIGRALEAGGFGRAFERGQAAAAAAWLDQLSRDPGRRAALSARAAAFAGTCPLSSAIESWDRLLHHAAPPPPAPS